MTPELKAKFLVELEAQAGNVTRAAAICCIATNTLYEGRKTDLEFNAAWEVAAQRGFRRMEDEARRRAYEGVDEPVFYQGEVCGHIKKYSDYLMSLMLKAHDKKYRERTELVGGDNPVVIQFVDSVAGRKPEDKDDAGS